MTIADVRKTYVPISSQGWDCAISVNSEVSLADTNVMQRGDRNKVRVRLPPLFMVHTVVSPAESF